MKRINLNFYDTTQHENHVTRVQIAVAGDGAASIEAIATHTDTYDGDKVLSQSESRFYSPVGERWNVQKTGVYIQPYCNPVNESETQREHPLNEHIAHTWKLVSPSEPIQITSHWGSDSSNRETQWRTEVTLQLTSMVGITRGRVYKERHNFDNEKRMWRIAKTEALQFEQDGSGYIYRIETSDYEAGSESAKDGFTDGCPVSVLAGFDWENFQVQFPK